MKRRIIFILLAMLLTLLAFEHGLSFGAQAADAVETGTYGSNITWTLDSNGVLTLSGKGSMTPLDLMFPTQWKSQWIRLRDKVKGVVLGNEITNVGDWAFMEFTQMEQVSFPDSLGYIGTSSFSSCHSLKNVTIPKSVKGIGRYAFKQCQSMAEAVILGDVTEIESDTFTQCGSLENVILPESIEKIGDRAFWGCKKLEQINFLTSLKAIGFRSFSGCESLGGIWLFQGM